MNMNKMAQSELDQNVPGLNEVHAAQEAAYTGQARYTGQEIGYDEYSGPPRPIRNKLRLRADELEREFPRAAVYLRAQEYAHAGNQHKRAAGNDALELIESGGNLDEAEAILNNWLPGLKE